MEFSTEKLNALASALLKTGLFASQGSVDKFMADVVAQGSQRSRDFNAETKQATGITTFLRGVAALSGRPIAPESAAADVETVRKTLVTTATPGSYLVPTIQADAIVEILGRGGVLRASGATVWPMGSIQKLQIPSETAEPTVEYLSQTTAQTPSDPNLGQLTLDLKERRALVALPNNLLRVSVPAVDAIVTRLLGKAFAKKEDEAFFGTGFAGGPTCLTSQPGTSVLFQSGGSLAYIDLLAMLAKASSVEAEGPFAWYMNPNTFFNKVLGLKDSTGRPIVTGYNDLLNQSNDAFVAQSAGIAGPVKYTLMGHPVYLSTRISLNVGSGNQDSYILLTNPSYLHIGDGGGIEVAVSFDKYFDLNQTAIRAVSRHDFAVGPSAGVVIMQNVA
jgi:HK97 family phage major capsid protein